MKQKFSLSWKGSKQPRKQHKYRENAPANILTKMLSVNLSKDLRKKYGKRNIPIRKEDEVKVMFGEFKKKTGKISLVDKKNLRVAIEGIQRKKKEGTKVNVYFDPSNLQIINLNLNDKKRIKSVNRKTPQKKVVEKKVEKKAEVKNAPKKTSS